MSVLKSMWAVFSSSSPVAVSDVDDVVPLDVDLGRDLLLCARLVDVDLAQAEIARPVDGDTLDEVAPGRGRDVDTRYAEFLEGDGNDARGRRGAHVAKGDHGSRRLFPGEHGRVLLEDLAVLAPDRLPVVDEVRDPKEPKRSLMRTKISS